MSNNTVLSVHETHKETMQDSTSFIIPLVIMAGA